MSREFEFIDGLVKRFGRRGSGLRFGIGSDCAVLEDPPAVPIVTTDMLVEGVHFDRSLISWRDAGYRSVTTGLSDLAAGGAGVGFPRLAFLSIAIPRAFTDRDLELLTDGFERALKEYRVTLAGGDTVATTGPLVINFTFIGYSKKPLTRSGAQPGDRVFVAGTLGAASAAVELQRGKLSTPGNEALLDAYFRPRPLLELGSRLSEEIASACIDVSDGLIADAKHIADESRLAMDLDMDRVPIHPALATCPHFNDEERRTYAASGGDDYALVFTVPEARLMNLESAVADLSVPCVEIGVCRKGPPGEMSCIRQGRPYILDKLGYEH